jgi:hypothetical protein
VRGKSADALTALRTSSSLKTLQEQTIKARFQSDAANSILKARAQSKAKSFNFKQFQIAVVKRGTTWNQSKQALTAVLAA